LLLNDNRFGNAIMDAAAVEMKEVLKEAEPAIEHRRSVA